MPVAFDTEEIYRFVFTTDRSKPVEKQPTLLFNYPTCREVKKIANTFDASIKAAIDGGNDALDKSINLQCDAVRLILCGWENFRNRKGNVIPYNPDELESILTDSDFVELRELLIKEMSQSELEKKRYALSLLSTRASSAPGAKANA